MSQLCCGTGAPRGPEANTGHAWPRAPLASRVPQQSRPAPVLAHQPHLSSGWSNGKGPQRISCLTSLPVVIFFLLIRTKQSVQCKMGKMSPPAPHRALRMAHGVGHGAASQRAQLHAPSLGLHRFGVIPCKLRSATDATEVPQTENCQQPRWPGLPLTEPSTHHQWDMGKWSNQKQTRLSKPGCIHSPIGDPWRTQKQVVSKISHASACQQFKVWHFMIYAI